MLCMVLALATFAFMALLATTASAAGRGKTFIVSGISMPKGAIPAANSGYSDYSNGGNPVSANGRYVVFQSSSDFQLPGVVPDRINVFRKDRSTGKIILISRASGAGAHQFHLPITCMNAGTSTVRTRVASTRMARVRPRPNIRMNDTWAAVSAANEIDITRAAAVMTRPV